MTSHLVERPDFMIPSSQRLIMREHNTIILSVTLLTSFDNPSPIGSQIRRESSYIISKHWYLWTTLRDPDGQLFSATTTQINTQRIITARVVKTCKKKFVLYRVYVNY
jgi:hypothetical protein